MDANAALVELHRKDRESVRLAQAVAVLAWDQETHLPGRGVEDRAEQLALLESMHHRRITDPRIGELLSIAADTPDLRAHEAAFLREKRREYDQRTKLPVELVARKAEARSLGQATWAAARTADDFAAFASRLATLVDLARETADCLGYEQVRYDALLDQFEPAMRTDRVAALFAELRRGLVELLGRIQARPSIDSAFPAGGFDVERQAAFSRHLLEILHYPADRGRLDRSTHPFSTKLGSHDVRVTSRYEADNVLSGVFSTIHEVGHGHYELGVAPDLHGSILDSGTSLAIHESQSRLWENMVGRSRQFWQFLLPVMQTYFPAQLDGVDLDRVWRAANRVQPSFIRVDADEVTYSLHVILRFELEQALIAGELEVRDLPEAWRAKSDDLFGIVPPTDALGVLQDVHWSAGLFGYFPTYALGNMYAAHFLHAMQRDLGDIWAGVAGGQTDHVLSWLREHIHRHGMAKTATQLLTDVTGEDLSPRPFLDYLNAKYTAVYAL